MFFKLKISCEILLWTLSANKTIFRYSFEGERNLLRFLMMITISDRDKWAEKRLETLDRLVPRLHFTKIYGLRMFIQCHFAFNWYFMRWEQLTSFTRVECEEKSRFSLTMLFLLEKHANQWSSTFRGCRPWATLQTLPSSISNISNTVIENFSQTYKWIPGLALFLCWWGLPFSSRSWVKKLQTCLFCAFWTQLSEQSRWRAKSLWVLRILWVWTINC